MNIIVAEDEMRARQAVVSLIAKRRPQHQVISAENGEQALLCLSASKCDLLLTDVKMPVMDGLALLENAHRVSPDTIVIVSSAYGFFSYVQKALKLGAYDYILKPFLDSDLLALIDDVESKVTGRPVQADGPAVQPEPQRIIMLVSKGSNQRTEEDWIMVTEEMRQAFLVHDWFRTIHVHTYPESMHFTVSFPEADFAQLESILHAVLLRLRSVFGIALSASIGPQSSMQSLYRSVSVAQRNADLAFYYDGPMVFTPENSSPVKYMVSGIRDEIFDAVFSAKMSRVESLIIRAVDVFRQCNAPPQEAKTVCAAWIDKLLNLHGAILLRSVKDKLLQNVTSIWESADSFTFTKELYRVFDQIGTELSNVRKNKSANLIERGTEYISAHYCEPGLSVNEIAKSVHFGAAYYASLFKKHTGLSIGQYILGLRIAKAKSLLVSTDLKIYAIAKEVGFVDDKYFIRVFVKEVGMTPRAYRLSVPSGDES